MSMGETMRALRGAKSQEEVAREVGITKSSYAMYERDERTPRYEVKVRLAKYFGVSVQELFFDFIEH